MRSPQYDFDRKYNAHLGEQELDRRERVRVAAAARPSNPARPLRQPKPRPSGSPWMEGRDED